MASAYVLVLAPATTTSTGLQHLHWLHKAMRENSSTLTGESAATKPNERSKIEFKDEQLPLNLLHLLY